MFAYGETIYPKEIYTYVSGAEHVFLLQIHIGKTMLLYCL